MAATLPGISTSIMDLQWAQTAFPSTDDREWVDIISLATLEYYRLLTASGLLYHWNRSSGIWEPANLLGLTSLVTVIVNGQ